ncbi:hypothetical protein ACIRRH_16935 [Kitasatospora sp. NPDC101235]|uniref:hypothetical protein n=1 Tax=Kitasatospora sp. NPDC101235 TaxID=3364101 RepID=UPI0037F6445E
MIFSRIAEASPTWQRILDVLVHRAKQRRLTEQCSPADPGRSTAPRGTTGQHRPVEQRRTAGPARKR